MDYKKKYLKYKNKYIKNTRKNTNKTKKTIKKIKKKLSKNKISKKQSEYIIAGWDTCGAYNYATNLVDNYKTISFNSREDYFEWLPHIKKLFTDNQQVLEHNTSPIIFFKNSNTIKYIGGNTELINLIK